MFRIYPFVISIILAFLIFSKNSYAQFTSSHLEHLPPNQFGIIEQLDEDTHRSECLSDIERAEIKTTLNENINKLIRKGIIDTAGYTNKSRVLFSWPIRQANGFDDSEVYTITNYVDHDERHNGYLKDYNCGKITYDVSNYSHKGIDIASWPFGWNKMDDNQAEVVAVADGTIIEKRDGNYDENCSLGGGSWNAVYVRHDDGSEVWYGHLKKWSLTSKGVGSRVQRGEYIGIVGSSGNSTGPHLHLEVYDKDDNLIDPYAGPCNDLNGTQSWWSNQKKYHDSGVNKLVVGSKVPESGQCNTRATLHEKDTFKPGDQLYTTVYLRHARAGQKIEWKIYEPDNTINYSWSQTIASSYLTFGWYTYRPISNSAPTGKWRFEITYNGETESHDFYVENEQSTPGCDKMEEDCSDFLLGTWEGTYRQYACGINASYPITITIEETNGCDVSGFVYYPNLLGYSAPTRAKLTGSVDKVNNKLILREGEIIEGGDNYVENGIYDIEIIDCENLSGIWRRDYLSSECNDPKILTDGGSFTLSKNTGTPNLEVLSSNTSLDINGSTVNISTKIINDGTDKAESSRVRYYLSTNNTISASDYEIGSDFVRELAPGESSAESISTDICKLENIPDGNYYVGFIIDEDNVVGESDETDNVYSWTSPRLNLMCDEGQLEVNLVRSGTGNLTVNGNEISVSGVSIKNEGGSEAGSSHIGYYLSTNTTITTQDIYLGEDYVRSLDPNESSTESFSKTLSNIAEGTYYLGIIIDYKEEVSESSESDNTCYFTTPKIVISNGKSNLVCEGTGNLSVNGNEINLTSLGVKNIGDTEAGSSHVGYYLSTNSTITTNDIYIGEDYVRALDPNEVSTESFSKTLTGIAEGTYYFGVIVDYKEEVSESDGSDNTCYFSSPQIVISNNNSGRPNLRCDQLGSLSVNGRDLSISGLRIKNSGNGRAKNSYIAYYLSTNSTISDSDIYLGEDYVSSLEAGESSTESFDIELDDIAAGTYYLGIIVDHQSNVEESDEGDNICTYANKVVIRDNTNGDCKCTNAYSNSICEDFQEYRTGKIGTQSSCWTTWSGSEGGPEDGTVGQSSDGNQYLSIKGTNTGGGPQDVVLQLGNRTSGKYEYKFQLFVYAGEKAYYNVLHRFAPSGSGNDEWAQEVFFDGNGTGRLKVNNQEYSFNYTTTKWIQIYQTFDISNDATTLYVDGNRVHTWKFTYEARSANGTKQLAALNFYPSSTDHVFYVDALTFEKVYNFNGPDQVEQRNDLAPPRSTATETLSTAIDFEIFPNPTTGQFQLQLNTPFSQETIEVEIRDITGKLVQQHRLSDKHSAFDLSNQPNGIYYVRMKTEQEIVVKQVVLVK